MDAVPEEITEMRRALGSQLAARRREVGMSQTQLANETSVHRAMVSHLECGRRTAARTFWRTADRVLGSDGALLAASRDVDTAAATYDESRESTTAPGSVLLAGWDDVTAVMDILGPSDTMNALEVMTRSLVDRYETDGPQLLAHEALTLRRLCHDLSQRVSHVMRVRVTRITAQLDALLAYMAVNLKSFGAADRFALRATVLATAIADRPLLAWIKGTQSFSAYYQQRYRDALGLAQSGLHLAGTDQQRIRLLSNGVARAAGKMGDRSSVDRAASEALTLSGDQCGHNQMTSCIDLNPYGWARTAANVATAYLSLGDRTKVLELTCALKGVIANSSSDWDRALVTLDEATALSQGTDPEVGQAAALGLSALQVSANKPIASVNARVEELINSLKRHGKQNATAELSDALRAWRVGAPTAPSLEAR